MRKALFAAGVGFALTVLPASAIPGATEVQVFEPIQHEDKLASVAALEMKTEQLIAVSEEQLELAEQAVRKLEEQAYLDSLKTTLRLSEEHVTFSSRLVLKEDKLLHSSRSVGYASNNAFSMNLLAPSAVTAYELNKYLSGTSMAGLGSAFIKAELNTGVNAVFLTSLAIHESGWGNSAIARNKNNLFGYGAYDRSPYQSAVHFSTVTEGVIFVADRVKENYLLQNGKYYAGSTLAGVNKRYSTDPKWGTKIAVTMNGIDASILANQNAGYEVER